MKGILFSASSFLLVIGIFVLATSFSLYNIRLGEETGRNLAADRVFYEFESLENMMRNLFYKQTGINVSANRLNATLSETLSQNGSSWEEDMDRILLFINNYSVNRINLNISAIKKQSALNITPGIIFRHLDYGNRKVEFVPPSNIFSPRKLDGYDVFVDIGNVNVPPGKCVSGFEANATPADAVRMCIFIRGSPRSCNLRCMYVDTLQQSQTVIEADQSVTLTFTAGIGGRYTFESTNATFIRNRLMLNNITEQIKITYPYNILQVNFTDFAVWKNDTVYLYRFST